MSSDSENQTEDKPLEREKKGFFKKLFDKDKERDLQILRDELGINDPRTLSIQEQFEQQTETSNPSTSDHQELSLEKPLLDDSSLDEAPMPPREAQGTTPEEEPEQEQQPQTPSPPQKPTPSQTIAQSIDEDLSSLSEQLESTVVKPSEEFSLEDLEEELQSIEQEQTSKQRVVELTHQGNKIITLEDLRAYIESRSEEQVRTELTNISWWASTHLYNNDLALDLKQLSNKQELLDYLDAELGLLPPRTEHKQLVEHKKIISPTRAEEHFEQLDKEHQEAIQELETLVEGTQKSTNNFREHFKTKNKELAQSLTQLQEALHIMNNKTYIGIVEKNKEAFTEWIETLAKQSLEAQRLNPQTIKEQLIEEIHKQSHLQQNALKKEKEQLKEQQKKLTAIEEDLLLHEKTLIERETRIVTKEEELEQQQQTLRKAIELHRTREEEQQKQQDTFIAKYDHKLRELIEKHKERKAELSRMEEELKKREETIRKKEFELPLKFKEHEQAIKKEQIELQTLSLSLEQRKKKLDSNSKELDTRRERLEEEIRVREQIVQQAIDKISMIDEDIKQEREQAQKIKKEIDRQGFKVYLEARLKEIQSDNPLQEHYHPPQELEEKHAELFRLIHECNKAITNQELARAKDVYDELKRTYSQEQLTGEEKDILYDAIRELYANLHLALLKQ